MNATSLTRITKLTIFGFMILMTACSPLVALRQPSRDGLLPTDLPTNLPTTLPTIAYTPTLEPTSMPTVQPSMVPTNVPATLSVVDVTACQDAAQYISDDGLDGTTYPPNTPFTKTWRLKNTGSCTWDSSYLAFQVSGTAMTQSPGYMIVPQGQTVAPGGMVDISVGMTSPVENGSYRSDWGLKKPNGQFVPVQGGTNGSSFYVRMQVSNGNVQVSGSIAIELEQGSGRACTADSAYFVHAQITSDGPTTASYEIGSTAGQISAGYFMEGYTDQPSPAEYGNLVFDQADTKTVNYRFVGPYPYPDNITVTFRVNGGEWQIAKVSCQG